MKDYIRIIVALVGLGIIAMLATDFHRFLEARYIAKLKERQEQTQRLKLRLLDMCAAQWPLSGENYKSCLLRSSALVEAHAMARGDI